MPGTKWKRSIKNPAQYHALRKKGFSKSSAARITNAKSKGKKMRRSAKQIAASRKNLIKARAARKRHGGRAKKVAKGVGVVALVAAGGYAAHKASGSQLIVSSRTPTVHHHVTGRPVGTSGFKRTGSTISYVHRNTAGDRHIVYAAHVHGTKVKTSRRSMPAYKPRRAFVHPGAFKKANYPHTQEAKNVAGRKFKHSSFKSGISEAEAMRRSRSYASARGGKISYAEQNKALRKYRKQKR